MVLQTGKKAIRAFGIAESFNPGAPKSRLAGVVMRTDLVVDGFAFGEATVGGDDATTSVLGMVRKLKRPDLNLIILSGCVISRYNIIDLDELSRRSKLPVVCLTYNETAGLEEAIKRHFPDPGDRLEGYRRLGKRTAIRLKTGYKVYVRNSGMSQLEAKKVLDSFTLQGGMPEPVRLAKLLARAGPSRS